MHQAAVPAAGLDRRQLERVPAGFHHEPVELLHTRSPRATGRAGPRRPSAGGDDLAVLIHQQVAERHLRVGGSALDVGRDEHPRAPAVRLPICVGRHPQRQVGGSERRAEDPAQPVLDGLFRAVGGGPVDHLPARPDVRPGSLHGDLDLVLTPVEIVLQRLDAEEVVAGYLAPDALEGVLGVRDHPIHRAAGEVGHQLQPELLHVPSLGGHPARQPEGTRARVQRRLLEQDHVHRRLRLGREAPDAEQLGPRIVRRHQLLGHPDHELAAFDLAQAPQEVLQRPHRLHRLAPEVRDDLLRLTLQFELARGVSVSPAESPREGQVAVRDANRLDHRHGARHGARRPHAAAPDADRQLELLAHEPVVRRELHRRPGRRQGDEPHLVVRSQRVEEVGGRPHDPSSFPEGDALAVDRQHDEPPAVAGRVGGVGNGRRGGGDFRGGRLTRGGGGGAQIDELGRHYPAGLAVDGNGELRRAQVGNRLAVVVDDADVDLQQLDAGAKHRELLRQRRRRQ